MLPTGSLEAEELHIQTTAGTRSGGSLLPDYRPVTWWVHYSTSCNTQSNAPEDWRNNRPKLLEMIGIINKSLLSHIVGNLYYL